MGLKGLRESSSETQERFRGISEGFRGCHVVSGVFKGVSESSRRVLGGSMGFQKVSGKLQGISGALWDLWEFLGKLRDASKSLGGSIEVPVILRGV